MSVRELEWLKANIDSLDECDQDRLNELKMVSFILHGEIRLPLPELVAAMDEAAEIVGKYMKKEENL